MSIESDAIERACNKINAIKEANTCMDFVPTDYGLGVQCSEGYFFYTNAEEVLENKYLDLVEYFGKKSLYAEQHCRMYLNIIRKLANDTENVPNPIF